MQSTQLKLISSRITGEMNVHIIQHELPKKLNRTAFEAAILPRNCHENATLCHKTHDMTLTLTRSFP